MSKDKAALSPTEFYYLAKEHLEQGLGDQFVQGEISGLNINQGRLVFFDLKDEESSVRCFMLVHELERLGIKIEDGLEVVIQAVPSVFKRNTGFHLKVRDLQLVGEGALQKAYEKLRKKLQKEGLFEQDRKRKLPRFPQRIGAITSSDAAAWTDFQRMVKNRMGGLHIALFPVSVQGMGAPEQIVQAFEWFNAHEHEFDVVVLTRGGGSLEDLWAFNDERVARAVFSSKIPVVVGVGHERDETLADFVADVRASTPSNAAEIMIPDRDEILFQMTTHLRDQENLLRQKLQNTHHRLSQGIANLDRGFISKFQKVRETIQRFTFQQERFRSEITHLRDRVAGAQTKMTTLILQRLHHRRDVIQSMERVIRSLNPKRLLSRGYTLSVDSEGRVIVSADQLKEHDQMKTTFSKGSVLSIIKRKIS